MRRLNGMTAQGTGARLSTESVMVALGQLLMRARGLVLLPLLAAKFGPEGYGVFTQVTVSVALLAPVAGLRLEIPLIRVLASADEVDLRVRSRQVFTGLATILVVVISLVVVAVPARDLLASSVLGASADGALMLAAAGYLLTTASSSYLLDFYRGIGRVGLQSALRAIQSILELSVAALVVILGGTVSAVLFGISSIGLVVVVLVGLDVRRRFGLAAPSAPVAATMIRRGLPLVPNGLLRWGLSYADRIVIVQVLGIGAVGTYAANYSVASLLTILTAPIGFVAYPRLLRLWSRDEVDAVQHILRQVNRFLLIAGLPAAVAIGSVSSVLLRELAGADFVVSGSIVVMLGLANVLDSAFQVTSYVFHLTERLRLVFIALATGVVLNVCLNVVLVSRLGLAGASAATLAATIAMLLLGLMFVPGDWRILPAPSTLAMALAGCGIAVVAASLTPDEMAPRLGAVAVGGACYVVALIAAGELPGWTRTLPKAKPDV